MEALETVGNRLSIPRIPGYTTPANESSLAAEWSRPDGDFPDALWPLETMESINSTPREWLTIEHKYYEETGHGGTGCVIVDQEDVTRVLESDTWAGHGDLGSIIAWSGGRIDDGLNCIENGVNLSFFCQVRNHHGLRLPSVDIAQPFLWYWDAIPSRSGWTYLGPAGRDEDLIRFEMSNEHHRVEIRALELRQYLAARGLALIVQKDYTVNHASADFA